MRSVIFVIVTLTLLLRAQTKPFGTTSFLTYGVESGVAAVYEFDYDGNFIQTVTFPGYTTALQGVLNSDGTLISLALQQTVNNEDLNVCAVLNANGELMGDPTKIVNAEYVDCHINGTDVWFNTYRAITYAKSGTIKSATTNNVIQNVNFILDSQLLGSRLYLQSTGPLYFQDPVRTTTTGNTAVFGTLSAITSYVHNKNTIYGVSGSTLKRYNLDANNAISVAYSYDIQSLFGSVFRLTAVDYNGATYVFVSYTATTAPRQVLRVTDDGTAFKSETILTDETVYWKGVSNAPMATCSDGYKDQDESDVDCGGSKCNTCDDGKSCSANSDCTNDFCDPNNKCATPTCADTYQNQDETDVDCGGTKCSKCADDKSCVGDGDCTSGFCDPINGNKCATPTCSDSSKNQDETDVDCGGSCNGCADGKSCLNAGDCSSGYCSQDNNKCATPTCFDSSKNQDETDVDCGGSCSGCALGKSCSFDSDCGSNNCTSNVCAPSCSDNILNQDETDVDCGGMSCPVCVADQKCLISDDCDTAYCNPNAICSTPSCSDGWKNDDETDVDCGGQTCIKCNVGSACLINSDCASDLCANDLCVVPPTPPVDAPVNDQSPQTDSPVSSPSGSKTPVNKKVSSGVVVEAAALGLGGIVVINMM